MYEMEGAHSVRLHHAFRLLVLARALPGPATGLEHISPRTGCPIPDERPRLSYTSARAPERLRLAPEGSFPSLSAAGDN